MAEQIKPRSYEITLEHLVRTYIGHQLLQLLEENKMNREYFSSTWRSLSTNPNITWDIVKANPKKPWGWDMLSTNPNITWEIVEANPTKPWDWDMLSRNPNITWDIVKANPYLPWDWSNLSQNPNITREIVEANPDIELDSFLLSHNPNITFDFIKKNLHKISGSKLAQNPLKLEYTIRLEQQKRRYNLINNRKCRRKKLGKRDAQ